jgi:F420-non-reducing hydrogenase iron-sulfur subunit
METSYEPVIIAFLCNCCSYQAADLAGAARLHYAPNMRPIRVMCSGRVEPDMILKALREGADGVLIAGCHPGECQYNEGNLIAKRRFMLLKNLLSQFGVEEERVQLVWVSASEGNLLAEAVDRMTESLRNTGPLSWSDVVFKEIGQGAAAETQPVTVGPAEAEHVHG